MDRFFSRQLFRVSCQENTLSLTTSFRFHYKCLVALLIDLSEKLFEISWQGVRLREKVVVVGKHRL